jgi:ABC-type transport system involved in cytochrome bd biosynthesis fused ATPase/permease subunit
MTTPTRTNEFRVPTVTIPSGLATQLGVFGTSAMAIVALVSAVLDGDHTPETLVALATATIILATTIYGRMKQAAAVYHNATSPLQGLQDAVAVVNAPLPTSGEEGGTTFHQ